MTQFWTELKRRNVFRVGLFYIVAAWLLVQVADILLDALDVPEWGMRLILVILLLGFPVAVVFAWVFELTPEGIKREKDVDRTHSITPETGRKLDQATIVVVLLVGALVVWQQFGGSAPSAPGVHPPQATAEVTSAEPAVPAEAEFVTLAVLPFRNFSSDAENEYFVDGLSEELMNILAGIDQLRVAARTSSFSFKGKDLKVQEIGRELQVAHVLEGSVRKSGDTIRITAQLIQVDNGFHLWSENFDRQLDDVFAIQDEIAAKVAAALRVELLGEAPATSTASTNNARAYDRYLAGRFHFRQRAAGSLHRALEEFQAAIDMDPEFAAAWAGVADTYEAMEEFAGMPQDEAQSLQKQALDRAEALDPDLPEVLMARATLHLDRNELLEADRTLRRVARLKPNDTDILMRAAYVAVSLTEVRRHDELVLQALAVDPLSVEIRAHAAEVDVSRGDLGAASRRIELLESAYPNDPIVQDYAVNVAFRRGDWAQAFRHLRRLYELRPNDAFAPYLLSISWRAMDHDEYAQRWLETVRQKAPESRYAMLAQDIAMWDQQRWTDRVAFWQARLEVNPQDPLAASNLASSLARLGRLEEAAAQFERSLPTQGYRPDGPVHLSFDFEVRWLAWLYRQLDRADEARVLIGKLSELYEGYLEQTEPDCQNLFEIAEYYALIDDDERAIATLERSVDGGCYFDRRLVNSLLLQHLQADSRVQAIYERGSELLAEQRAIAEREGWGVPPEA